ncbi:cell division protein FtsA [Candidatus Giovannonibacteria bacterium]|nr:cell division protein FtsA [Candidatus Giovannonibacteria bacterium]
MARNVVQALDLGSSKIKAIVCERRTETGTLRVLGAGESFSAGMRRGGIVSAEILIPKIKEAAREAERTSGIPFRHAYVSFGSNALHFLKARGRVAISRADNEVGEYDVERLLKQSRPQSRMLQNRDVLESFGLSYNVDNETDLKNPIGIKGENLEAEILFITALSKSLKEFLAAIDTAGLIVDDVIPAPLASGRTLLSRRQKEVGAAVLDIGAETASLGVFEENLPYSLEVFPFGSMHITNDIALGFRISLDEAEKIKISFEPPESTAIANRKLTDIVEARMEDMFELVEGHLKKVGRAGLLPGGVVLTGGGAKLSGIKDFTRDTLRLPSELGVCAELEAGHKLADPAWSICLGLCLLALDGEAGALGGNSRSPSVWKQKILSWIRALVP